MEGVQAIVGVYMTGTTRAVKLQGFFYVSPELMALMQKAENSAELGRILAGLEVIDLDKLKEAIELTEPPEPKFPEIQATEFPFRVFE